MMYGAKARYMYVYEFRDIVLYDADMGREYEIPTRGFSG